MGIYSVEEYNYLNNELVFGIIGLPNVAECLNLFGRTISFFRVFIPFGFFNGVGFRNVSIFFSSIG